MQATYVKFSEEDRAFLIREAQRRGCSMSDLVRQATLDFFNLRSDGPERAFKEQKRAASGDITEVQE